MYKYMKIKHIARKVFLRFVYTSFIIVYFLYIVSGVDSDIL